MLIGREKECTLLSELIGGAIDAQQPKRTRSARGGTPMKPLSIYVSGVPGTGKTASVRAVINQLQEDKKKKFEFISVDCFDSSTTTKLQKSILEKLGVKPGPAAKMTTQLNSVLESSEKPIVILLDEIDNLTARKDSLICKAFSWPQSSGGKAIMIGIANSLDLIDRLLPKMKDISPPELITFAPYTNTQLIGILQQRLADENAPAQAIDLCSRKIASMSGDVRKAFQIANDAMESLRKAEEIHLEKLSLNKENDEPMASGSDQMMVIESEAFRTPEKSPSLSIKRRIYTGDTRGTRDGMSPTFSLKRRIDPSDDMTTPTKRSKKACREVLKSIEKVYASPMNRSRLPLHPKILFATLMRLISVDGNELRRPPIKRDRLFKAYQKVCEKLSTTALDSEQLENVYSILESQGMIALRAKKREVSMEVEFEVASEVINDNTFLRTIESIPL